MAWYTRTTPAWILSIIIIFIVIFEFFIPNPTLTSTVTDITTWATIIVTWMLWIGLINILRVRLHEIRRRTPGRWYFSIYGLAVMFFMMAIGFASLDYTRWGTDATFVSMYMVLYVNLEKGAYGCQAFWCLAGILRAYKARTLESLVFLLAGVIGLLGVSSLGAVISTYLPMLERWIVVVPLKATYFSIAIGLGIGMLVYGVRFLLGKEMTALGAMERRAE